MLSMWRTHTSCDSCLWWVLWGPFNQRHGPCSKKQYIWPWCAVCSWHVALREEGCDTTSRPISVGKLVPVKGANVFERTDSDHKLTAETGEKLLMDIYNGNDGDSLDTLQLVKYQQKVSTGSVQVQPKVLPPASAAATIPTESTTRSRRRLVWVPFKLRFFFSDF